MFASILLPVLAAVTSWFEIRVVDESTGRGVPLVELETVNRVQYITDNAGRVAFLEPGLMGGEVFFHVRSHGYEYPKDGFGYAGVRLTPKAGMGHQIKLKRLNMAERLYRITGEGLYRDSVLLGRPTPLAEPLINAEVVGQDSTQAVVHNGKIFWTWGDTSRRSYPLGLFRTAGATSRLPRDGGLDPSIGINLDYFKGEDGFARNMVDLPEKEGLVWVDGLCTVSHADGTERLMCHYSRRKGLVEEIEHGPAVFDEQRKVFTRALSLPPDEKWRCLRGHPTRFKDEGGDWILVGDPFLHVRVPARFDAVITPAAYEAWDGSRWQKEKSPADPPVLTDVETGKDVKIHAGSIRWNAYRRCWVMIAHEAWGKPSNLGEVWFAEAPAPTGPWKKARRIVTHDRYSFYNPVHHDFFDQDGGRQIYFEGTYSGTFSREHEFTPRYDYNQVMYRLDLNDERLRGVRQ